MFIRFAFFHPRYRSAGGVIVWWTFLNLSKMMYRLTFSGSRNLCLYYPFLVWILWLADLGCLGSKIQNLMGSSSSRFVKRRVSLWSRLWSDRYLCEPRYEATGICVSPIIKWAVICVSPIIKWAGICVSPIIKWAGICVSPIIKWAGICVSTNFEWVGICVSPIMNSNNGYLREPYITSDWSSVCV